MTREYLFDHIVYFWGKKKKELSEQALIRDVVYTFQGIDGTYVRWSERARGYVVAPDIGVPANVRSMVGRLCELGYLFRKVTKFIQQTTTTKKTTKTKTTTTTEYVKSVLPYFCSILFSPFDGPF